MNKITVERVMNEPIVIVTVHRAFTGEDVDEVMRRVYAHIDSRPFYYVVDLTAIVVTFSMMLAGFGADTALGLEAAYDFSDVTTVFVGMGNVGESLREGYQQAEFGSRRVLLFDTLEEALNGVRAELIDG